MLKVDLVKLLVRLFGPAPKSIIDQKTNNNGIDQYAIQQGNNPSRPIVRILYSRHSGHNVSDFVAQLLEEILKNCKKYSEVRRDRIDPSGSYKPYIHQDIESPNCKLFIILAEDSFNLRSVENIRSGHEHFYDEIEQCARYIEEKKKEGMFVLIYLKQSTKDNALSCLQDQLIAKIDAYGGKGEEIMNLIQTQQAIDCIEPTGNDAYNLKFRDLYKKRLEAELEMKSII